MSRPRTFGQLGEVFDGPHATPRRLDQGPYFLSISSLDKGRLNLDLSDHVSPADFALWTRRIEPREGDLLFSYETRLGEAALMPARVEACLGRRMALLRPDTSVVDPRFLLYYYLSPYFQSVIAERAVHGATVSRIPLIHMGSWPVDIPPIDKQRRIAEVLGALDDKMVENRAVVQDIDELVLCLFLQATEGAEKTPLSSIALVNPSTLASAGHGTLRYVDIGALGVGSMPLPIQTAWSDAPSRARRPVNKGDVLWSTVRPNLRAHALSLYEGSDLIASTGLAVIRPIEGDYAFVYECVRTAAFTSHLVSSAAGSAYPAVRPGDIGCGPVPCLSIADRRSFQSAAGPLRQRQWASLVENRSLAALRDALLPKLMSGELRVRDAEKQVEEVV